MGISTNVVAHTPALASQFNALRQDAINAALSHKHGGGADDGDQIPFSGLSDVVLTAPAEYDRLRIGPAGTIVNGVRESFNVCDYGADRTGATDSTAAIQTAITDAIAAAGGNIYLPPGTYRLNSGLSITASHIMLVGSGLASSILNYHGADAAIEISCGTSLLTDIMLRDFGITCQYTGTTKGVYVSGSGGGGLTDSIWERLAIKDCGNTGLYNGIDSVFTRVTIRNCFITHCGDFGIAGYDQADCIIEGNYFNGFASLNYPAHAIYLKRAAYRNRIINNTIVACLGINSSAISIWGDTGTCTDNMVNDNTIYNNLQGIRVSAASRTEIQGNLIVSDNASGLYGIYIYIDCALVRVVSNTVIGMSGYGIFGGGASGHPISELVVVNNDSHNNTTGDAISYTTKATYANNYVNPVGILAGGMNALSIDHVTTLIVNANQVTCGARGIVISDSVSVIVESNQILDNTSSNGWKPIWIYSTDRSIVAYNDITNMTSKTLMNLATLAVTRNNLGYVTHSYGAAASVADGGTIAHGVTAIPTRANVTPSVAGEIVTVTSLDSTNVTVAIKKHIGTAQVETATVVGTITGSGDATVITTAAGMAGSPITTAVAVLENDTAAQVATKIRAALNLDANIAAMFAIGGTGANVVLTRFIAAANDGTLNVSIDNGTCTGLTAAPTSANTTAGVLETGLLAAGTTQTVYWEAEV